MPLPRLLSNSSWWIRLITPTFWTLFRCFEFQLAKVRIRSLIIFWRICEIFKEWATEEGNLHRMLASKILSAHGRTTSARSPLNSKHDIIASQIQFIPDLKNLGPRFPQSRKKDCNMSKLKTLVSMIYQDRVRVMNPQKLLAISFFRKSPWPEFQVPCLRKRKEHGVQKRTRSIRQPLLKMQESQSQNK